MRISLRRLFRPGAASLFTAGAVLAAASLLAPPGPKGAAARTLDGQEQQQQGQQGQVQQGGQAQQTQQRNQPGEKNVQSMAVTAGLTPPQSAEMLRMAGIFDNRCASCHNSTADGHGTWSHNFIPVPANLTQIQDSASYVQSVIVRGVPGTMMPAHPDMDAQTINGILAYVGSQPKNMKVQYEIPWDLSAVSDPAAGGELFVSFCQGCHGERGGTDTPFAANPLVWPKPANLQARNSTLGRVYDIVTNGRPGTMMPANDFMMTALARWKVSQYVVTLFDPKSTDTIDVPNGPIPTVANIYAEGDMTAVRKGENLFDLYCAGCHSGMAEGTFIAPMLCDRHWYVGDGTDKSVWTILLEGLPGRLMISTVPQFSDEERWQVISYVRFRSGLPDPMAVVQGMPPAKKGASR